MNLVDELVATSWRRLVNLVAYLPRESATMFARVGEGSLWGPAENMLAAAVDLLAAGNWQRSGNKNAARPKPWPRPGVSDPNRKQYGGGGRRMSVAEWEKRRQARHTKVVTAHGD